MGQAPILSQAERNQAQAAIARLAAAGKSNGRFQPVPRTVAQENPGLFVFVLVHDGPQGHGRTIFAEYVKGSVVMMRRTQGEDAHSETRDWREIDLSKLP